MTSDSIVVTMRVPLKYGRFNLISFDPREPVDFAPFEKWNGARMAQTSAPLSQKPLKENGAGAPLLHSAPEMSHEWRKPSPSRGVSWPEPKLKKSPMEDLEEARSALAGKAAEMAVIDSRLAPVRQEESEVQQSILATHDKLGGVVQLRLDRAVERKPLFRRLDEISAKWGPLKNERKTLYGEIKTLERQISHIQRLIGRKAKAA